MEQFFTKDVAETYSTEVSDALFENQLMDGAYTDALESNIKEQYHTACKITQET